MVKAIKVMLIPNNVQKTKMFQYAGASRFAYNWALAREIENYEKGGKFISDAELRKEFTKLRHSDEYAWLLSISNNVTKQAIKDACTAYKNFFKGLQKFPRFKSRKRSMPIPSEILIPWKHRKSIRLYLYLPFCNSSVIIAPYWIFPGWAVHGSFF